MKISSATPEDFAAILALQALNHLSTLPADARDDGFLTTHLDEDKLEYLRAHRGLFVAKIGPELAGYVCTEGWELNANRAFHERVATLFPLHLEGREIDGQNSRLYGPVCVASQFRGQNVLPQLLAAIQEQFSERFSFLVTFIDTRNARSLAAHERKLGFQIVGELPYDDTTYHVLAFSLV